MSTEHQLCRPQLPRLHSHFVSDGWGTEVLTGKLLRPSSQYVAGQDSSLLCCFEGQCRPSMLHRFLSQEQCWVEGSMGGHHADPGP